MSFTIRGRTITGRKAAVTWDAGKLTGDEATVDLIEIEAQVMEGRPVGWPAGPYTETKHLENPLSALALILRVIEFESAEGDVPTLPAVPPGAIP